MKRFLGIFLISTAIIGSLFVFPTNAQAQAVNVCNGDSASSTYCKNKGASIESIIKNIVNILLFVAAVVSVIVIIVSGILFAVANGDSSRIAKARNSTIYAAVGLVIALFSYAIVNFVFNRSTTGTSHLTPSKTKITKLIG